MKIALCSDEPYPVQVLVEDELKSRGHQVVGFGSVVTGREEPWPEVAEQAALAVARGDCDEGVFFCWSGTGICMAANKVFGIRAALCSDAGQARAARIYNHANVLCLSNRSLSLDLAKELLEAWFSTERGTDGASSVAQMNELDERYRRLS
jgi:ribose 5-phosphate isomerase B